MLVPCHKESHIKYSISLSLQWPTTTPLLQNEKERNQGLAGWWLIVQFIMNVNGTVFPLPLTQPSDRHTLPQGKK